MGGTNACIRSVPIYDRQPILHRRARPRKPRASSIALLEPIPGAVIAYALLP